MKPRVTMRDVARSAGVSPMTVSRALKDDGTVNAETRAHVRQVAERLGYVYDTTAQAFRTQRSGFLAVTMPSINNANFAATHRALRRSLSETDLQILLGITDYRLEEEERLVRQLLARRPDALVLTGGFHTEASRSLIEAAGVPVIEMWDLPEAPLGHAVGFSNADAMRPLVEHLAKTGRRALAFLGANGDTDRRGAERRRGVERAARDLGLPEVKVLEAGPAPVTMGSGAEAMRRHRAALAGLDALVCVSDPVAFGALSACTDLGIRVPEDLAVTGFGAFDIATINTPAITTVDVGAERIGVEVGRLISAIVESGEQGDPETVDTGGKLLLGLTA